MNVMMVVVKAMTTANANITEDSPPEFVPESLRGFMTNSEWDELLSRADYLITSLESIEDSNTRQNVFELLKVLDKVHRESLTRLVRLFKDGVLEQVITDPPIRTLMDLYDLLPQSLGFRHRFSEHSIKFKKTSSLGAKSFLRRKNLKMISYIRIKLRIILYSLLKLKIKYTAFQQTVWLIMN